ncbi:MAG: proton-conducting transporter membrane subunit [Bacteroidota bacterium]
MNPITTLLPLLAPGLFLIYALATLASSKNNWVRSRQVAEWLGWSGIIISAICATIVFGNGPTQFTIFVWQEIGFAVRLDALSATMLGMISLLGFIILKFSANYLEGEARKAVFMARLATTIASVELLVLSGNLGQLFVFWVLTSVCLHFLLVFYRHRPQAIAAARKKFIVARIGDASLLVGSALLYLNLGTGDLGKIFAEVQEMGTLTTPLVWATVFMVFAAILKSAQFPTHGWLIEVVETPTPVSALLHAGLLNAGPFLIVRMAFLMSASTPASLMLIIIGGFTAMFASVVYLTQPTVKVSLGYSSVAHMGFSLLICGFGVYSAAILHLVAHSFYKAHSFLSSGSVVDAVKARKVPVPKRRGNLLRIGLSIGFSVTVYAILCYVWGIHPEKEFGLMAIGAIIVMGLSQFLVQTLDSDRAWLPGLQSACLVLVVGIAFFTLEQGAHWLLLSEVPAQYQASPVIMVASTVIISSFIVVVILQLIAPRLGSLEIGKVLGIHLRNGLYANVLFDRLVGSLKGDKFKWANLTVRDEDELKQPGAHKSGQRIKELLIKD